jgi:subtilisin family serine protease
VFLDLKPESLWNLEVIGTYHGQKRATGQGIDIGIVDTGIDYMHPQLKSKFGDVKGYDFVEEDLDPMDKEGHGTHVSGTACSDDYGVSLESRLFAVRVLDEEGYGPESDVIAGIEWCIKNNIDVVNMSLGSAHASRAFEAICCKAYDQGIVLVAAAGNEGYGPSYPASFDESVISVAATDHQNKHAPFSNIWETNDISAPGVGIMSCFPGGRYTSLSGTSMATPHVTGTIALAMSLFKQDSYEIEQVLGKTAQHLKSDSNYRNSWVFGEGLVRVDRLIDNLMANRKIRNAFRKGIHSRR